MRHALPIRLGLISLLACGFAAGAAAEGPERDLWIHPRGDGYDPERHYQTQGGELFYHAENDIHSGLGNVVVRMGPPARVEASVGPDLWAFTQEHQGWLKPVLLWDTNGDGRVDRSIRGRLDGHTAIFDGQELAGIDFPNTLWQLGIVYKASPEGLASSDGRYLASIDSGSASVLYPDLADVGPGPPPGLVISKHRVGLPLDFAAFVADPTPFLGDFDDLTRVKDADDWTVKADKGSKGKLRTHFEREDLFIVRTAGKAKLDVLWGDLPLTEFLEKTLEVSPRADGCYSSLDSQLVSEDGEQRELPQRLYYCPAESLFVFEAPDGYQIFLTALLSREPIERTEASMSIGDNIRLYAAQVFRRTPQMRATGSVEGNVVAGFAAAGDDMLDAGRRLVVGTERTNVHTGQTHYRTSPLLMAPRFAMKLAQAKPVDAVGELLVGTQETVYAAADTVSAVNNAVINPLVQGTVGLVASPEAADTTGHWVGAFTQAWVQNLPGSERTFDAFSPLSLWRHNRGFAPSGYTRTDTQLNIDRVFSIANMVGIYGLSTIGGGSSGGGGSNGGPGPIAPDPPPMMMMMPGCD